jgi:hypothetical protein
MQMRSRVVDDFERLESGEAVESDEDIGILDVCRYCGSLDECLRGFLNAVERW